MVKFKNFSRPLSVFPVLCSGKFNFQGLFKTVLYIQCANPIGISSKKCDFEVILMSYDKKNLIFVRFVLLNLLNSLPKSDKCLANP